MTGLPPGYRIRADGTFEDQPPRGHAGHYMRTVVLALAGPAAFRRSADDDVPLDVWCGVHCGTDSRGTRHCGGCHRASDPASRYSIEQHERAQHGGS